MILELTVGFETNMEKNSKRKFKRYTNLITRLKEHYDILYVDLSMGAIGVIGNGNKELQKMFDQQGIKYKDLQRALETMGLEPSEYDYLVRKIINVCIRACLLYTSPSPRDA